MKANEISSIGKLIPHPDIPDEWLISQPVSVGLFDGLNLNFILQGDLENDTGFLSAADRAIETFLMKDVNDRLSISNPVYENYKTIQNYYDSGSYNVAPLDLSDETEIWKYIHPQEIYISREFSEDANIYLQIHCECEWEPEHGLQFVFKNAVELSRVSGIDGNSTN